MRIVQTFWSSYGNPTGYSYGWIKPEYNLMSWALSCLSLKKYYNKVELYTDSRGYEILIEKMGLPYSSAHIVFDDFECLPYHWAFSKIKTYSLQKEHFLHVDGDIFISRPFSSDVINGKIVAQNKEIVTESYASYQRAIYHNDMSLYYNYWTETYANHLSKGYFGAKWQGGLVQIILLLILVLSMKGDWDQSKNGSIY